MRIPMRSPTDTSFTPPDLNEDSPSPDRQALDLDDTSMSGLPNSSTVVPLSGHTLSHYPYTVVGKYDMPERLVSRTPPESSCEAPLHERRVSKPSLYWGERW